MNYELRRILQNNFNNVSDIHFDYLLSKIKYFIDLHYRQTYVYKTAPGKEITVSSDIHVVFESKFSHSQKVLW